MDHLPDIVSAHSPAPERPTPEQAAVVVRRPEHISRWLDRMLVDIDLHELRPVDVEGEFDRLNVPDPFDGGPL
jgi:hypothetical protein